MTEDVNVNPVISLDYLAKKHDISRENLDATRQVLSQSYQEGLTFHSKNYRIEDKTGSMKSIAASLGFGSFSFKLVPTYEESELQTELDAYVRDGEARSEITRTLDYPIVDLDQTIQDQLRRLAVDAFQMGVEYSNKNKEFKVSGSYIAFEVTINPTFDQDEIKNYLQTWVISGELPQ